jgi:hypothetical protein
MRVDSHAKARKLIAKEHLKVKEVVRQGGKVKYNCVKPKKAGGTLITITVVGPKPAVVPTRKQINKELY